MRGTRVDEWDPMAMIQRGERTTRVADERPQRRLGALGGWWLVVVTLVGSGCVPAVNSDSARVIDGNREEGLSSALGKTYGEPNDEFTSAIVGVFNAERIATLQGTVSRRGDLDVFRLGPLAAGEEVLIEANTPASSLDVSIAVFDSQGRLMTNNDDISDDNLDSIIRWIVRREDDPYYLVVTNSAFAASNRRTGTYSVDVRLLGSTPIPPPRPQVLFLDFDGGSVNAPLLGNMTIVPFEAGAISSRYQGMTQRMKQVIRNVVAQNYERFDVVIVTSDEPAPARPYTSIYFGGFDREAYGIAENVDLYNLDRCDDAVIFSESFSIDQFTGVPGVDAMATAIGNVASHEAGHLLGLNHVADSADIMDARSPADTFLADQEFLNSPLSSDIMSIGTQDSVLLLTDSVGLVEAP
jgi:hypothetical protein